MAENATTIEQLDSAQPANNIKLSEEDDQLRLIKIVKKLTFIGVNGDGFIKPITATESDLNFLQGVTSSIESQITNLRNGQIPVGGIINYNGLFSAIPANFKLCDGLNGTPDMVDRFVKGTSQESTLLNAGGQADSVNVSHNHNADHNHTASTNLNGVHTHNLVANFYSGFLGDPPDKGIGGDGAQSSADSEPAGAHTHTAIIPNDNTVVFPTGIAPNNANIPVYYKSAFIMRVS